MNLRRFASWPYFALTTGALFFLAFFRARYATVIYGGGDDFCYVTRVFAALGEPWPGCSNNYYAPGATLTWLPAGVVSWLVFKLTDVSLRELLPALIGLSSFLFWVASLELVRRTIDHPSRNLAALVAILNVPILFYATNRTTLAHPSELVLAALGIFCLSRSWPVRATLAFVLLALTRFNDAPALGMIAGYLIDQRFKGPAGPAKKSPKPSSAALIGVAAVAAAMIARMAFVSGYGDLKIQSVFADISLHEILHVLFGADWGMLWTMPAWLFVFGWGFLNLARLSWCSRAAWLWMLAELMICVGWKGHGSEFGYRYAIGSFAAALWIACEWRRRSELTRSLEGRILAAASVYAAFWVTAQTWLFKTAPSLTLVESKVGPGWINPTFQIEVLKSFLHPVAMLSPLGLSPPAVLVISAFLKDHEPLSKYALSGPRLWVLALATALALGVIARALGRARRSAR